MPQKSFEKILKITKGLEGGKKYTNHKKDRGGPTRWGITKWTAMRYGYYGSMKDLPEEKAIEIYRKGYWSKLYLSSVNDFNIQLLLFDICVNGGRPVKWIQRTLNVLNRNEKDYPDLKVDGKMGPNTVATINTACRIRRGKLMLKNHIYEGLISFRTVYFIEISEKRPDNEVFTPGWIQQRIIKIKKYRF
jgi:lysozyme family protein